MTLVCTISCKWADFNTYEQYVVIFEASVGPQWDSNILHRYLLQQVKSQELIVNVRLYTFYIFDFLSRTT